VHAEVNACFFVYADNCLAYAPAQVSLGKADAKQLAQEKQRLGQMQQKLEVLEDEKTKTASRANSLLSFLGLGGSSGGSSKAEAAGSAAAASGSSSAGKQGIVSKSRGSLPGPAQQQQQQAEQSGSKNVLVSTWEALGQQLLQLEGRLSEQESKTQKQRLSVQQLKEKVGRGGAVVAGTLG
jgi:flagellar biosynthesis chaperone FliJ